MPQEMSIDKSLSNQRIEGSNTHISESTNQKHWYALRDLKRANAKSSAYKLLSESHFEVFTPLKWILYKNAQRKRIREQVPVIQDLLFVHSERAPLDVVVENTPTLQYRFKKGDSYRQPMTVRDNDMARFIHAVNSTDSPRYFLPEEITSDMCGKQVRIIGGPLDGYEGNLLKVRGTKKKHLLLELPGFFTAGVEVDTEFIQLV